MKTTKQLKKENPSVLNIGYLGTGTYKSKINNIQTKEYLVWRSMLVRCYSNKYPSYANCSVDSKWHNFQIFGKWFTENYIDGYELDKDLLIKGNKIYSENTATFIPREINRMLLNVKAKRGNLKVGVSYRKQNNKYRASINSNRKQITIGDYNSEDEAFIQYKKYKELEFVKMANKYKNDITPEAYNALINLKVDEND